MLLLGASLAGIISLPKGKGKKVLGGQPEWSKRFYGFPPHPGARLQPVFNPALEENSFPELGCFHCGFKTQALRLKLSPSLLSLVP